MPDNQKSYELKFFAHQPSGNEPVKEWLDDLDKINKIYRTKVMEDLRTLQLGYPLNLPRKLSKFLTKGIYECRTDLPGRNIARVLYCVDDSIIYLLVGFIKKTEKTPQDKIDEALRNKRDLGL